MTCDVARERINELVEGGLDGAARVELEAHLATCPECAAIAEDLEVVRRAARGLAVLDPPERVWTGLARELPARQAVSRPAPSREWVKGTLAVAAVLLAAVAIPVVVRRGRVPQADAAPQARVATPQASAGTQAATQPADSQELKSLESELQQAESHYVNAIQKLEVLAKDRRALDPRDAVILQKNLLVIDSAIGESRAALRTQPTSEMAQESLFEAFRSQIALLQDTLSL